MKQSNEKTYDVPVSRLRIYRMVGGSRIPFTLVLDSSLLVVDEYSDVQQSGNAQPSAAKPRIDDSKVAAITEWVADPTLPNRFPGTEQLREEFFAERAAMFEADPNCPACKLGGLINKYRDKLASLPME